MRNERKALEANERFYEAFNRCDLELMKKVWLQGDKVICIHPGWGVLKGFDPIIKSWSDIFNSEVNVEIKPSHVEVIASEDLAWVGCQENLFTITMHGVQTSKVHATNLFQCLDGEWKMVLHHASSVAGFPEDRSSSDA